MSGQSHLFHIDITTQRAGQWQLARWLLPVGWGLAAVGFLVPWIAHPASALSLSGADIAEFVKFLPHVLDGSLQITRQCFYLPPLTVVISIALLIGSGRLGYTGLLQAIGILLSFIISLQILPPAWSPASLMAAEFRAQALALGASWLLLAGFWLWKRLPAWLPSAVSALLSVAACGLSLWQFLLAKPAIDQVYGVSHAAGWGLWLCLAGLGITAVGSGLLACAEGSQVGARQSRR